VAARTTSESAVGRCECTCQIRDNRHRRDHCRSGVFGTGTASAETPFGIDGWVTTPIFRDPLPFPTAHYSGAVTAPGSIRVWSGFRMSDRPLPGDGAPDIKQSQVRRYAPGTPARAVGRRYLASHLSREEPVREVIGRTAAGREHGK
jgi:hypothetical protein